MPGSDDLVARLKHCHMSIYTQTGVLTNPDGPEAADEIERLSAALASRDKEIERLAKELASVERELDEAGEEGARADDELGKLEARAETAERERDEAKEKLQGAQMRLINLHLNGTESWADLADRLERERDEARAARTEARKAALEEAAKMLDERGRLALAASASMPDGILKEREAAAGAELIGAAFAIRALIGTDPTTDRGEG